MGTPKRLNRRGPMGRSSPRVGPSLRQDRAAREITDLKRLFKTLSDPLRLQILAHLAAGGSCDVTTIATVTKSSMVAVSKSLTLLRGLDLVEFVQDGNRRIYVITDRIRQRRNRNADYDLQILGPHDVVIQVTRARRQAQGPR